MALSQQKVEGRAHPVASRHRLSGVRYRHSGLRFFRGGKPLTQPECLPEIYVGKLWRRTMTGENHKTTTKGSTSPPANISEFNTITGLVFSQLYGQFPVSVDLDRAAIESAMSAASSSTHVLQSGKPFTEVFAHSLNWLSQEGYIRSAGPLPYERVTLTQKGLTVLNAVPEGLSTTVGSSLATTASAENWAGIGDLVGGIIGGFTKSVSGS